MMLLLIIAFSPQPNNIILKDFTLHKTRQESFFSLYEHLGRNKSNIIITSDLFFHSSISLYDSTITLVEKEKIIPQLKQLLHPLYKNAEGISRDYFEVALSLLGVVEPTTERVKKEIKQIENAGGFGNSPILGINIDYSQFKPRGHYTKSKVLSNYFKAMMWLSFPKIPIESKEYYDIATGQATMIGDLDLLPIYLGIDSLVTKLVGTTDDITPLLILKYKDTSSPIDSLRKFCGRIVSKSEKDIVKYSFMPQRFILDSYIFQMLTYDYIIGYTGDPDNLPFTAGYTEAGIQRVFPRGLDVFGVFGSNIATEILKKEGDTDYPNYFAIQEGLKRNIKFTEDGSLYDIYLLALKELLGDKNFMSPTYQYKNLITASGGWCELRHATILYAKQSYTALVSAPPKREKIILIEPFPEVYRYLLKFAKRMHEFYPLDATKELISILNTAIKVSEKELDGEIPDIEKVQSIPYKLKTLTNKKRAPLIADVHTDPNTGMVLEEAIGNPFIINISLDLNSEEMNFTGVSYSYYEFKQSMSNRLTDDEWREVMKEKEIPAWIGRFTQ